MLLDDTKYEYEVVGKTPMTRWYGPSGCKLFLVHTMEEWKEFHKLLMQQPIVAVDTETQGFNWFGDHRIVGMSFGWGKDHNFYIPVRHEGSVTGGPALPQLDMKDILEDLKQFFNQENVWLLLHNCKFDQHFFMREGIVFRGKIHDTRVRWQFFDENAPGALKTISTGWRDIMGRWHPGLIGKDANDLEKRIDRWRSDEAIARRKVFEQTVQAKLAECLTDISYQGWKKNELKQHCKHVLCKDHVYYAVKKDDVHYGCVPIDLMAQYASVDVYLTWEIFWQTEDAVTANDQIKTLYDNEMALSSVLFDVEEHGITMRKEFLEDLGTEFGKQIADLEAEIKKQLGDINLNSTTQLAEAFQALGIELTKVTDSSTELRPKYAIDREVLEDLATEWKVAKDILALRELVKLKSTYVDGILSKLVNHGDYRGNVLHPSFNQNVATGRMCIAEGSLVQTPCDRSKNPGGIPIEQIAVGDQVYCYDAEGNLHLRKVLWAGCKGVKDTVTLKWRGSGHKHEGELCLTPDHRVRLFSGEWREAQHLKPGDRVMALSGSCKGPEHDRYFYLYGRHSSMIREHRFAAGANKYDIVHHIDGNKLNNTLANLETKTPAEHAHEHKQSPEWYQENAKHLKTPKALAAKKAALKYGEENHSWKHVSRATLLRWAAENKGQIRKIMKATGHDFAMLKNKYALENIDLKAIKLRYNSQGEYLSKKKVRESSELVQPYNYKSLGVGYATYQQLLEFYGLQSNHEIVAIVPGPAVAVYDLEVEEHNNFVANEVCVHNSSYDPNCQNIPGRTKNGKLIRKAFGVPNDEFVYLLIDYSQIEVRLTAHYSQDPLFLDAYAKGQDIHTRTMCEMWNYDYDEVQPVIEHEAEDHPMYGEWKLLRNIAKRINFGIIYGVGPEGLSKQVPRPQEFIWTPDCGKTKKEMNEAWVAQCKQYIEQYLYKYIGVKRFINRGARNVFRTGKAVNGFGRVRNLPWVNAAALLGDDFRWMAGRAARQGVNFEIQGEAADLFKIAVVRVHNLLKGKKSKIVSFVHDEVQIYLHKSEIYLLSDLKHAMEDFPQYSVPIEASFEFSDVSWGDKHKIAA